MKKQVEFLWWSSRKIWTITGKDIEEITNKCHELCKKYKAIHFQIL